jgi:hypothetical protein
MPTTEEVFFMKDCLRRQRVSPRRRTPNKVQRFKQKVITRCQQMRQLRWWLSWFPSPVSGRL